MKRRLKGSRCLNSVLSASFGKGINSPISQRGQEKNQEVMLYVSCSLRKLKGKKKESLDKNFKREVKKWVLWTIWSNKCLQQKMHKRQFGSAYGFKINRNDQARIRDTKPKLPFLKILFTSLTLKILKQKLLIQMQDRSSWTCHTVVQKSLEDGKL